MPESLTSIATDKHPKERMDLAQHPSLLAQNMIQSPHLLGSACALLRQLLIHVPQLRLKICFDGDHVRMVVIHHKTSALSSEKLALLDHLTGEISRQFGCSQKQIVGSESITWKWLSAPWSQRIGTDIPNFDWKLYQQDPLNPRISKPQRLYAVMLETLQAHPEKICLGIDACAAHIGTSDRSLQRYLLSNQTNWHEISKLVKAQFIVSEGLKNRSASQIARKLSLSEASVIYRHCQEYFGCHFSDLKS
jgi:hypothetical protein